jgi:hypothetical protein
MLLFLSLALLMTCSVTRGQGRAPLSNDDIIKLVQLKFSDDVIVAKIKSSPCKFDTSVDGLVKLREAGVSDDVLEAMTEAGAPSSPTAGGRANAPVTGQSAMTKPYALIVEGETNRPLPASRVEVAHAKGKWTGDSLQSASTDDAITSAAMSAAAPAIASVEAEVGSVAEVPDAGAVLSGVMAGRKTTETYIWAVPHPTSRNAFRPGSKVELFYDDIPDVDPDEYEPVLVKLEPTKSNTRLVCAQKVEMRAGTVQGKEKVVLEPQAANISKLGPGHVVLEPEQPLAPGEYGVLLRPPNRDVDLMGQLGTAGSGFSANEAALIYRVWDFTVRAAGQH